MSDAASESLIAGGGPAGSMVALELLRAGRSAVLLEKSKGPHDKVCGEFLSRESILYLQRHNIDVLALGGVPIQTVRFVTNRWKAEADLPFAAVSLTRRRLDEEMLRVAVAQGAEVHRDTYVEDLKKENGAWCATLRDGRMMRAASAFVATGKHDLRGWSRPPGTHRGLVAFKMYYRLTPEQNASLGHAVELILFPGGYAGLQPVEHGATNLCFVIDSARLRQVGPNWSELLCHLIQHSPHLAERLEQAVPLLDAPLAASHIPYGHIQRTAQPGLWRVGDQAAVVPSFSGDGMAIALHSGAMAAAHFLRGASPESYHRTLHAQIRRRIAMATKLSQLLVRYPHAAQMVRAFPVLLSRIAWMTRVPNSALLTEDSTGAYTDGRSLRR